MSSLMGSFPDVSTRNMVGHDNDNNGAYNDSPKWFIALVTTLVAVPVLIFVGYFCWHTLIIITKCRGNATGNAATYKNINGDINDDNSFDDIKQMNGSFRLKQRTIGYSMINDIIVMIPLPNDPLI
jgi:predicted negative regulator of RcsB-dependent stress response